MNKQCKALHILATLIVTIMASSCQFFEDPETRPFDVSVSVDVVHNGRSVTGPLRQVSGLPSVPLETIATLSMRAVTVAKGQDLAARELLEALLASSIPQRGLMACNGVGTLYPTNLQGRCSIKVPLVDDDPERPCENLIGTPYSNQPDAEDYIVVDLISTFLRQGVLLINLNEMERWAKLEPSMDKLENYLVQQDWAEDNSCGYWANEPSGA